MKKSFYNFLVCCTTLLLLNGARCKVYDILQYKLGTGRIRVVCFLGFRCADLLFILPGIYYPDNCENTKTLFIFITILFDVLFVSINDL